MLRRSKNSRQAPCRLHHKLVVNKTEADLVRLIIRCFLDLGSALLLIRELNAHGHRTKSWTTQAGTFREERPFDKGTLYKILRNRTYLGEAVHKGKSYPGEHGPIVDHATWDRCTRSWPRTRCAGAKPPSHRWRAAKERRKPNGSACQRRTMAGVQEEAKHAIRAMSPLKSCDVPKPQPQR
jgi:hypothetical protein